MFRRAGQVCTFVALAALLALPSVAAAQSAPPDSEFEKVTLNDLPGEPMDLAVLPDGRVLHTTRPGELWLHNPATGRNTLAASFNLYSTTRKGSRASRSTRTSARTTGCTSTTRHRSTPRWTTR